MAGACQYFSGRSRSVERQEEEAKAASDECIPTNHTAIVGTYVG